MKYNLFKKYYLRIKFIKMKKITILIIAILTSLQINAQSKVGTIDVDYIISKMPQLEQVNIDVNAYGKELENQLQEKVGKYEALIKVYQENEATYSDADKKTRRDEIIAIEQDIQKFQKNGGSLVQIRRNELMRPLYQLIGDAMNTIATEEKFTQILTTNNTLAYLDPTFDITKKVLIKLGLPIPEEGK